MKLESLPAEFSEQAKFDREKGFIPVRITFLTEKDNDGLYRYWPENRIPVDYKDQDDVDAEGKYNPELFEHPISPIVVADSDDSSDSMPSLEVINPDQDDTPLIEF